MIRLGVRTRNLGSWLIGCPRWVPLPWCETAELEGATVLSDTVMGNVVVTRPRFGREGHVSLTYGVINAHRRHVSELVSPLVTLVVRLGSRAVVLRFPVSRYSYRGAGV